MNTITKTIVATFFLSSAACFAPGLASPSNHESNEEDVALIYAFYKGSLNRHRRCEASYIPSVGCRVCYDDNNSLRSEAERTSEILRLQILLHQLASSSSS